jgi:large subunit ribosomal protein L18
MASNETVRQYQKKLKRAMRVRAKLHGTSARPRLCVNKSNNHISAQFIDDDKHISLGGTATYAKEFRDTEFGKKSKKSARKLGEKLAEIAKQHNIVEVIFDRGAFKFHGVLAELADAARAGGLRF